jgi:hypothetical protein
MKKCTKCLVEKDDTSFYVIQRKDRKKPQLYRHCKECSANVKAMGKDYYRNWELLKNYGITLQEYNQQVDARQRKCDICSTTVTTLHVDHSHETGKIRGYLCGSCNRGIGLLKDSPSVCRKAAEYLDKERK